MESILHLTVVACCIVSCIQVQGSRFSQLNIEQEGDGPDSAHSNADSKIGTMYSVTFEILCCNPLSENVVEKIGSTCQCECKKGFLGSPPNCSMGLQLWEACYNGNPCGPHSECIMDEQNNRQCSCMSNFDGSPPNCTAKLNREFTCEDCGHNSEYRSNCSRPTDCSCAAGFVGRPPNCSAGPTLLKSCDPYPCGPNSQCENVDGVTTCSCLPGYHGEPPNCKPGPELWRVCFKERPCNRTSICELVNQGPKCTSCPSEFIGRTPYCLPIEETE